jgi:CheY-like chemotaxis protein
MNGFELIARLREDPSTRRLPAIALTAYVRGTDRARALEAGFDQHVAKPVHLEELAAVIGRLRVTVGRD